MSPSAQDTVTVSPLRSARGRVVRADDRGDAQLARDDRRVAGAAAAVGDDRARRLHHRLPVGRGRVGDQHFAGLELGELRDDRGRRAPCRSRPSRPPRGPIAQHFARCPRCRRSPRTLRACARGHRLGPRLHDVELCRRRRPSPTRCPSARGCPALRAVVLLDLDGVARRASAPPRRRCRSARARRRGVGTLRVAGAAAALGVDHLHLLAAERCGAARCGGPLRTSA